MHINEARELLDFVAINKYRALYVLLKRFNPRCQGSLLLKDAFSHQTGATVMCDLILDHGQNNWSTTKLVWLLSFGKRFWKCPLECLVGKKLKCGWNFQTKSGTMARWDPTFPERFFKEPKPVYQLFNIRQSVPNLDFHLTKTLLIQYS